MWCFLLNSTCFVGSLLCTLVHHHHHHHILTVLLGKWQSTSSCYSSRYTARGHCPVLVIIMTTALHWVHGYFFHFLNYFANKKDVFLISQMSQVTVAQGSPPSSCSSTHRNATFPFHSSLKQSVLSVWHQYGDLWVGGLLFEMKMIMLLWLLKV